MKFPLEKKELVALFMESPFYFDLLVRERLNLLKDHERRFTLLVPSFRIDPDGPLRTTRSGPWEVI